MQQQILSIIYQHSDETTHYLKRGTKIYVT